MRLCAPAVRAVTHLPERIDTLLPIGASGAAVALAGPPSSTARYLPHDSLLLLAPRATPAWRITLPPYVTPPGLVTSGASATTLHAVLDNTILSIDLRAGSLRPAIRLDLQALGWPAAVAADNGDRLYVAGQPAQGWEAVVEALTLGPEGTARVAWRAKLGLFHAGVWLGRAFPGYLAVYLPGTYDAPGSMLILDERRGGTHSGYAVPAPPIAADPAADRLYVDDAGSIRALSLHGGTLVATTLGHAPLAPDTARGVVAFVQGDGVTLAAARTLRPLGHLALPGITALAATPDGATLLAGLRDGLARVDLGGCAAA